MTRIPTSRLQLFREPVHFYTQASAPQAAWAFLHPGFSAQAA